MLGIPNILGYPYPMIFKTEPVGVGYQKCRYCCYIRQMDLWIYFDWYGGVEDDEDGDKDDDREDISV